MSKYDSAGLAMIPSGYKASKVYSLIPNSSDGDFDFARSSSATRVNKDGLIEVVQTNVPRLDYPLIDGVVQDTPSLLLEPSRSNQIIYSEDYSQATWTKNLSTVTIDNAISPDGSQNASKVESSSDGLNSRIEIFPTVSDNTSYTASVFVKKGDLNFVRLTLRTKTGVSVGADFDVNNGLVGSTLSSPDDARIDYYGNGWYRVSVTENVLSGGTSVRFQIILASADNDVDTDANTFLYVWGAMIEAGSYATSYIPTSGSTVTRATETCNGAGTSADFNDSEGVLFAEMSAFDDESVSKTIAISDGTSSMRVQLFYYQSTIRLNFYVGGVSQAYITKDVNVNDILKVSLKYKSNDIALWVNGFEVGTDTSNSMPTGLNTFNFDSGTGSADFYGKIKQAITFKQALTDAELEDLTSWDTFNEMATQQLYTIE